MEHEKRQMASVYPGNARYPEDPNLRPDQGYHPPQSGQQPYDVNESPIGAKGGLPGYPPELMDENEGIDPHYLAAQNLNAQPYIPGADPYPWKNKRNINIKKLVQENVAYTKWTVLTSLILVTGNALFVVAFATNGWGLAHVLEQERPWAQYGLWQYCTSQGSSHIYCIYYHDLSPIFHACRAFAIMSLIVRFASFVELVGYMVVTDLNIKQCAMTIASCCGASALFSIICFVTFVAGWSTEWDRDPSRHEYTYRLNYSFGLAVGASGLDILACIIAMLETSKKSTEDTGPSRKRLVPSNPEAPDDRPVRPNPQPINPKPQMEKSYPPPSLAGPPYLPASQPGYHYPPQGAAHPNPNYAQPGHPNPNYAQPGHPNPSSKLGHLI